MDSFKKIRAAAVKRLGEKELAARLPKPKSAAALRKVADDRYFSQMSLRIFRAGLKQSMVDARWPDFEEAFAGFDPHRVRAFHDEDMDRLMSDRRLIRHGGKMRATLHNAAALCDVIDEFGGMGAYLADWPGDDAVGLWFDLAKRFKQLGGNSGPYFLRMVGKDSFVLTTSVVKALNHWGAFKGEPKGKGDRRAVQQAFNTWADESGLPLCQISMTLAASVP